MRNRETPNPIDIVAHQNVSSDTSYLLRSACEEINYTQFVSMVMDEFNDWKTTSYDQERKLGSNDETTTEEGVFSDLINRYTKDTEQTAALVELGEIFRESDSETVRITSYQPRRTVATKRERNLSRALKQALHFTNDLTQLTRTEISQASKRMDKLSPDTKEFSRRYSTSKEDMKLAEIREQVEKIKTYSINKLTDAEAKLLTGVAIVQLVELMSTPGLDEAAQKDSIFFGSNELKKTFETPLQRALYLLNYPKSTDDDSTSDLHSLIGGLVDNYPFDKKLFGKKKQAKELHEQIAVLVFLPEVINAIRTTGVKVHSRERALIAPILRHEIRYAGARILENTEEVINNVGKRVESAEPNQELMLEALLLDRFKDGVVAFVLNTTLELGNEHESRVNLTDRIARLTEFSLHAALTVEQSQLDYSHLQEVFETLNTIATERQEKYSISNSHLRRLDPDWRFMSNILNTNKDILDKAHAKEVCRIIFALAELTESSTSTTEIFDQFLQDMDSELHDNKAFGELPRNIRGINENGTHFEPLASWLFENVEKLARMQGVPEHATKMLRELAVYKCELNGKDTELDLFNFEQDNEQTDDLTEESTPPSDFSEADPLDELLDIEFTNLAEQLDWVVFPQGSGMGLIKRIIEKRLESTTQVNWDRLKHLVSLTDKFDGRMYISRDQNNLGTTIPYLISEFKIHGRQFAVAECPQIGNATYIVCNDQVLDSWQELLRLTRSEARELGAKRVIHPTEDDHIQRIVNQLNTMLVTKV